MKFKKIELFAAMVCSFSFLSACTSSGNRVHNGNSSQTITSLAPTTPFDSNTIDGVLATVTDQVLLLSDLQQAILVTTNGQTRLLPNGQLIGGTLSTSQAEQILESLINQKVLQIKATELGFDVSDEELSQRIQEFLKQRGFSEADLETQLTKSGKSMKDYRLEFKSEVLKQQLIGRVISPLVNVSDDEVKSFYLQQTGSVKQISTVKLRSLLIRVPENEQDAPLNSALVKGISKKIADGENFVTLVKQFSMASDASTTEGILPPRPISELPAPIKDKLSNLKINQVIGPFVLGSSVFFFQYLGADFIADSDLQKNFGTWKAKLQDIKFNERLSEYLKSERTKLKANIRPFHFNR
jgi:peptidyl-prolyl cis-trans isomerase SurA